MTLQRLLYFRTAASLGSFNAAARALRCTQPAVSEQVRQLERELGVALFARGGRGLTLTSAGRAFQGHAERVAEAADDALASVGRRGAVRRDRVVTMGVFRNAPYYDVAGLAARFCAVDPDAHLRLPGQNSSDVAAAVRAGELEAGLVVLPVDDRQLDVRPLFRDEVLVLSADPARTRRRLSIAKLAAAPLILYDATHGFDDPTRRQFAAAAQEAGVALTPRVEVEHIETALQLVSLGLGDTIAARAVIRTAPIPDNVSAVGLTEPIHDSFALITRRGVALSPGTLALVNLVDDWAATVAARLKAKLAG
ncbi:HTH-type transcriptional regulator CynR [Baekduia alba]|uniref:LysR family transcriptional regulator n=1 Tax=Baekduia alba TaxID=2997333 RepID=UPI00233FA541|nr:LysR family transcriptional regulator [Baekduia alba]WCB96789.1 HTH-type transcriptional regulator CynR [Baekduia alba]